MALVMIDMKTKKTKRKHTGIHYVYQLKLQKGKYYVGSTTSPKHRLEQHIRGGKLGAAWTSKYKPVKVIHCQVV